MWAAGRCPQVEALPPPAEGVRRVRYYDSPNLSIELERQPSGKVSRYWRYTTTPCTATAAR
jgi:hypothetical protein